MKRPWSYGDDLERKSSSSKGEDGDDRRRLVGKEEGGDCSGSGSELAYDRRRRRMQSSGFGLRREFYPKGFRTDRQRSRKEGRSWIERQRIRGGNGEKAIGSEMEEGERSVQDLEKKKGEEKERTEEFCEMNESSEKEEKFVEAKLDIEEGEIEGEDEDKEGENMPIENEIQKETENTLIGNDIQKERENAPIGNDIQKERENAPIGNDIQKERENAPIGNEIQKESENATIGNEIQKESENATIGNGIQKERENKIIGSEIQKESENALIGNEIQKERENTLIGNEIQTEKSEEKREEKEESEREERSSSRETETERNNISYKEKGKGLLVLDNSIQNEKEEAFNDPIEISLSKPSFDFLSFKPESSSKLKTEKSKENLKTYSLDLSLSLPGISSDSQITQNPNPKNSGENPKLTGENHENSVKSRFLFQPVKTDIPNPSSSQTLISQNPNISNPKPSVIDRVLYKITNEPLNLSSEMLFEMRENSISYLKNAICEIISNPEKKNKLNSLKHAIQSRLDLTSDNLLKCPRPLLEILTALKTSLTYFFNNNNNNLSISDLVAILMNKKCRNSECGNEIPVSNCTCKFCISNPGFCSHCMCIICSDFDSSFNTCSWVGCDLCMHWCHTNCALNKSLIKPGIQIPVSNPGFGTKPGFGIPDFGIRFVCEGCGHENEMFGFVKEVFKTCCEIWEFEVLVKELGFVERIFEESESFRERKLRDFARKMVQVLIKDKSNHARVVSYVLGFLNDGDSSNDMSRIFEGSERDQFVNIDTKENSNSNFWILNNKNSNFEVPEEKPVPVSDDLEKIIKLKKAEAKMYQEKSNDAKKEVEGLKRIIYAKNKRIDEQYYDRMNRIQLGEFEERRKRRFEEFRVLEKEYKMFFEVKVGMESEVRDLMVKLEGAKCNF